MAPTIRNPARWDRDRVSEFDHAGELIDFEVTLSLHRTQAPRLSGHADGARRA